MNTMERQKKITNAALLGIFVNILIAIVKIIIGLTSSSLAVVSEGINNAADAGSSVLTLAGTKLSVKHPDEKHPFGYGRVEYLTGMIVGSLILFTGFSLFRESIESIIHPEQMSVTYSAIIIVAVSGIVKLILGIYTIGVGKETGSDALKAVGEECRGDSFISIITILSIVVFLFTGHSFDGWVGVIFSIVIMKSGFEALKNTASDIIGNRGEEELAKQLYREIRETQGIINVADMMLHNYGPNRYSGSVNVEIDHKKTIGEIYEVLHDLQLRIMHDHNVTMVFGIYAVDYDSEDSRTLRKTIADFIKKEEHIISYHAVYVSRKTSTIYVDFVVDYRIKNWDELRERFTPYLLQKYPDHQLELTIETEYV